MKTLVIVLVVLFVLVTGLAYAEDVEPVWTDGAMDNELSGHDFLIQGAADTITRICWYEFKPQKDITAYEVALVLTHELQDGDEPPEEIKRHIVKVCYD